MGFFSNEEKWVKTTTTRIISENELPPGVRKRIRTVEQNEGQITNADTFSRVQKILAEQLGIATYEVQLNSNIVDDLGADSLDFVELIMAFEDEFKIEISDVQAEKIKTVADIVNLLEPNLKINADGSTTRIVSEDYVKQKMAKSGRQIKVKIVGGLLNNTTNNYKTAESPVERRPNNTVKKHKPAESSVERVKQIIAEQLNLYANAIHMSDRIIEDLGANYNDKCSILDLIGEEFNVNFFGKEIRTVGNIFNYIS